MSGSSAMKKSRCPSRLCFPPGFPGGYGQWPGGVVGHGSEERSGKGGSPSLLLRYVCGPPPGSTNWSAISKRGHPSYEYVFTLTRFCRSSPYGTLWSFLKPSEGCTGSHFDCLTYGSTRLVSVRAEEVPLMRIWDEPTDTSAGRPFGRWLRALWRTLR